MNIRRNTAFRTASYKRVFLASHGCSDWAAGSKIRGSIPGKRREDKGSSLLQNVQSGYGAQPTSYSRGTWSGNFFSPAGYSGRVAKLTNRLHLVPCQEWVELYLYSYIPLQPIQRKFLPFPYFTVNSIFSFSLRMTQFNVCVSPRSPFR